jgi:hypothetical protein
LESGVREQESENRGQETGDRKAVIDRMNKINRMKTVF